MSCCPSDKRGLPPAAGTHWCLEAPKIIEGRVVGLYWSEIEASGRARAGCLTDIHGQVLDGSHPGITAHAHSPGDLAPLLEPLFSATLCEVDADRAPDAASLRLLFGRRSVA